LQLFDLRNPNITKVILRNPDITLGYIHQTSLAIFELISGVDIHPTLVCMERSSLRFFFD
jgi:hypothetical protein